MIKELLLKNTPEMAIVDPDVYDYFINEHDFKEIMFVENLRVHSHGYPFYQKSVKKPDGKYYVKTIYLHKIIAEKFIEKPEDLNEYLVLYKNGNKLDCRKENLFWADRCTLQRIHQKANGKLGFKGVFKEGKQYKAIAYIRKEQVNLGKFETPEEAAKAYNDKIQSVYGDIPAYLNKV